jgi:dihydroflavonol-4-reductase
MGKTLVTGATGFVGSHVVRALVGRGDDVRVTLRASSARDALEGLEVEVATAQLGDRAALRRSLRGVDRVFHVAGTTNLRASPAELWRVNVEGTRTVMEEALRAGVERIVYTSSVATLELRDDMPADETRSLPEGKAIGAYKRSKVLAERVVEEMVQRRRLPAVIVNPSAPIGPRDVKPTPTGRIIVECASGRMPGFVRTGLNLVHVDDVAAGHLAALRRGVIGERYILGGENVLLADMLAAIATIVERRPPTMAFPIAALYPIAFAAEAWARMTGKEPFATVDGLRMAQHYMFFNDAKARRELGYTSRPYREGLADAIAWFRQAGYLR